MVAIVGGALRRYLRRQEGIARESLVFSVPISVRTEEQKGTGGNQFAFAFVAGHTDIADPVERVEAVGKAMRRSRNTTRRSMRRRWRAPPRRCQAC